MRILAWLAANYHWQAMLCTGLGIIVATIALNYVTSLSPTWREAVQMNKAALANRMTKPAYVANKKWNGPWNLATLLTIFLVLIPFSVTLAPQPLWRIPIDMVVILMVYDFFYYFTHRFVFHDGGFLGGPLVWMHAVHHQQLNPCRSDSSYIHPLEVTIGLGLYAATIFLLARAMGEFNIFTIVITWVAFTEINLHNHDLWTADRPPFRYLAYASKMHHNHHARFTGGNYATISLLYDWMFGTLDNGEGGKGRAQRQVAG